MLWVKSFHIIFMVAWFAGLFYLPRLFVYHSETTDSPSIDRFRVMEKRLYWAITTPAGILTTIFGAWLVHFNWQYYTRSGWFHGKMLLVIILWLYHLSCGHYVKRFAQHHHPQSARFFRFFNEIPTILLIGIVLLVVIRPF